MKPIVLGFLTQLHPQDDEYMKIENLVKTGSTTPNTIFIKKVQKVIKSPIPNFENQYPAYELKFHGTTNRSRLKILKKGFELGKPDHNMFGAGIYCADDPNKGSQYTKGSNKLIVVKVYLGNKKEVIQSNKKLSKEYLKKQGFDSVYSPGGNKGRGGCRLSEYVVYDVTQITPGYVVECFRQPPSPQNT